MRRRVLRLWIASFPLIGTVQGDCPISVFHHRGATRIVASTQTKAQACKTRTLLCGVISGQNVHSGTVGPSLEEYSLRQGAKNSEREQCQINASVSAMLLRGMGKTHGQILRPVWVRVAAAISVHAGTGLKSLVQPKSVVREQFVRYFSPQTGLAKATQWDAQGQGEYQNSPAPKRNVQQLPKAAAPKVVAPLKPKLPPHRQ